MTFYSYWWWRWERGRGGEGIQESTNGTKSTKKIIY